MNWGDMAMKYIFLHGLGQNASSWDKTRECLADKLEVVNTVMPFQSRFISAVFHLVQCLP